MAADVLADNWALLTIYPNADWILEFGIDFWPVMVEFCNGEFRVFAGGLIGMKFYFYFLAKYDSVNAEDKLSSCWFLSHLKDQHENHNIKK